MSESPRFFDKLKEMNAQKNKVDVKQQDWWKTGA